MTAISSSSRSPVLAGTFLFLVIGWLATPTLSTCEVREPPNLTEPPQEGDAGFYLTISGNPDHYEPGDLYTVSLRVRTNAALIAQDMYIATIS